MATATQTVPNYCTLITRSRLMTAEQVKNAYRIWQESLGGSDDGDAELLRKFLVLRKHLTDYQSHLLMRGHTEGYFLDDYKILDSISKGSLAGVYKAMHASGQIVAIKVLPPSKAKDPTVLSRFQREGKLLTKLDHPNVVRAFQIGEAGGKHYVAMEYFESEPLDEILTRRKRLPPAEAVRLIHQVLLGLQQVFEKGMVHRDLKPANLVLVPPPTPGPGETTLLSIVKILDLGLGRTTFDDAAGTAEPETHLTSEGSLLGAPDYLAPEQARNAHDTDIRADIYSLGCILHHLLTGQTPFPDKNVLTQIVKHATENAPPLSQFLPQVPDGLQQALNWMMAKDPSQRYPTPARAAQALQMFMPPQPEAAPTLSMQPAYQRYLESGGHIEPSKTASLPPPIQAMPPGAPNIPVGRLHTDGKKKHRKKDRSGLKPEYGAPPTPLVPEIEPFTSMDEYDVEVVSAAPPPVPTSAPKAEAEHRSLFDPDRRDFIMAGVGGGIVALALLIGWGVSRLIRGPAPTPTAPDPTQAKPIIPSQPYIPPREKIVDPKPSDDPKPDDKKDEMKKEEPKTEEMKKEPPKTEEMKKEEPKTEEMKKEPPKLN